ncbi:hypothetical protein V8E52_006568 [Russula decolorans]
MLGTNGSSSASFSAWFPRPWIREGKEGGNASGYSIVLYPRLYPVMADMTDRTSHPYYVTLRELRTRTRKVRPITVMMIQKDHHRLGALHFNWIRSPPVPSSDSRHMARSLSLRNIYESFAHRCQRANLGGLLALGMRSAQRSHAGAALILLEKLRGFWWFKFTTNVVPFPLPFSMSRRYDERSPSCMPPPPQFFSETPTDQTRAPPGSVWGFKRGLRAKIEQRSLRPAIPIAT